MRYLCILVLMLATTCSSMFGWGVRKSSSAASGSTTCSVQSGPLTVFLMKLADYPTISGWLTAITGDGLYPGSYVYLAVGQNRFNGEEKINLNPELVQLLKTGKIAHFAWSPWPWGVRQETTIGLDGFAEAYQQCVSYVGGEPTY